MESGITNESKNNVETENVANTDSADSFESFIYDLFEKNGILNDVRAYLRGHIVDVLKSAQTGEPPPCQKNFTQRLDLTYQALNMLIAEYLMRLKFSYSFSVFISEIPLANMVFAFAKSLMEKVDENNSELRFKEGEIWSILNYLGLQCDSEHASNILQMYNSDSQNSLLLCILKSMPMYKELVTPQSQSGDQLESPKSMDSEIEAADKNNLTIPECSHCAYCTKCQNKLYRHKDRYKKKKKCLAKNATKCKPSARISPANSDSIVKNIRIAEKSLIEEMFQQLKSVYETEVEMVMVEEEKKVKRSMATHAMQLQQKRTELEETFKARELELERNVKQKKKFLWGLARSLRDQHEHMTRAMHDVRAETERLEIKEGSLKNQLAEAELILKQRGEEMRAQISNELAILEVHLESMKRERENITRERSELENLKTIQDSTSKVIKLHEKENEQVHSHYDLLKNELEILKTFLKSSQMQAKCVIERGTSTDTAETVSHTNIALNNTQGNEKPSKSDDFDERVKMNQVVNDFRKKNVNFSQSNLDEIYHEVGHERSRSSNSSEAGDTAAPDLDLERGRDRDRDRDLIQRLRDENDRLKALARQRSAPAPPASRPRTAPAAIPHTQNNLNTSISATTLNVGWRKGAGEELSIFSDAQPRILVPGDTLPFIGVLRDRHGNNRRPAVVSRTRALAGGSKRAGTTDRDRQAAGIASSGQGLLMSDAHLPNVSCSLQPDEDTYPPVCNRVQQRPRSASGAESPNNVKSNKSSIKDTRENLWRKDSTRSGSTTTRSQSPTTVLREAKQRLRKLEIEAEAVEQSYRDFRRMQSERRATRDTGDNLVQARDVTRNHSSHELDEIIRNDIETNFAELQMTMRSDFDKCLRDYKTKFNTGGTHLMNKPSVSDKVQPIPDSLDADCTERDDYLEAPLTEFRKLYTSTRQTPPHDTDTRSIHTDNNVTKTDLEYENSARNEVLRTQNKQAELQILKQNISQLYHTPNRDSSVTDNQPINPTTSVHDNDLREDAESISEVCDIKKQSQELLLVVQSSVNSQDVTMSGGEVGSELFSARMTIIVSPKRVPDSPLDDMHSTLLVDRSPQHTTRSPLNSARSPQHTTRSPHHSARSPLRPARSPHHAARRPQHAARSPAPEQAAHLTRNDVLDAIFHADPNNESSIQMRVDLSKDEVSISEYDKGDYPDEFTVDNYVSQSDTDRSRLSLPAMDGGDMPEDDNFWDS